MRVGEINDEVAWRAANSVDAEHVGPQLLVMTENPAASAAPNATQPQALHPFTRVPQPLVPATGAWLLQLAMQLVMQLVMPQ